MLYWLLFGSSYYHSKGKHTLATGMDFLVMAHLSAQADI